MAKDRKKLIHIHSSIPDKQPTPQSLAVGEIAVNNAADQEFLSIKNSEDKVKRFSSDEQMITWMEKKEVMPYVGYVRGGAGPSATSAATPTKDEYGSYGILDSDLSGNTSEIVIKLNQVAASATTKHERVNGSKDRYNKEVNPTTDSGVNDGAGFFIDMSRYAMQGANPEFSGITTTCYAVLNGRTEILGGTGTAGNCRSLLNIDVLSATTKASSAWTSASTAVTVIGSNDTTISGNTTLKVSGTTTETKKGNVTETNLADKQESTSGNSYNDVKLAYSGTTGGTTTEIKVGNVTESHSGTTTENKKGNVTENNLANKTENTTGNVVENTTGTTTITRTGDVKILDKNNHYEDVTGNYSGTTTGTTTEVKVGNVTESHSGTTTENKKGDVTENNLANKTENTTGNVVVNTTGTTTETKVGNVTENHSGTTTDNNKGNVIVNNQTNFNMNTSGNTTFTTTGDTVIHSDGAVGITAVEDIVATSSESSIIVTANDDLCETAGDVAALKGVNKTNVGIDCSDAGRTKVTNVYGDTINERANTADIRVTSAYTSATTATTIIGTANTSATTADYSGNTLSSHVKSLTHSGDTLNITESSSTTVKSPSTTISGCTKIELITDELNFKQCTTGTVNFNFCDGFGVKSDDIKFEECTNNAGKIVIKENATEISGKTLTIRESGATDFSGATLTTTTTGNTTMNVSGNTAINTSGTTTLTSTGTTTIEATGTNSDVCISATDSARVYGKGSTYVGVKCDGTIGSATTIEGTTLVLSGNTTNISGATTLNLSGKTVNVDATDIDVDASNNYCLSAATKANFYGKATNIGIECGGTIATATTIEGTTVGISGNTTNISGATTLNISGKTINVDATDYDLDATNVCVSGSTKANFYGKETNIGVDCGGTTATTINVSGTTINEGGTTLNENFQDYDINASKTYCVSAATNANFYGKTTNIGVDCGGTTATTINVSGTTINEGGTTNNNNFTTINNTATTINNKTTNFNVTGTTYISGDTTISGATIIGGVLTVPSGLSKKLTWTGGTFTADTTGYNGSADNVITVPTDASHITRKTFKIVHNGSTTTYDPGATTNTEVTLPHSALSIDYGVVVTGKTDDSYDTSAAKTVSIPTAVSHMTRGKLTVKHNGLEDEFDPATDKTLTLPHSALSIDYGANVTGRTDDSYDTSAAKTVYIPTSVKNLSNWNGTCYEFDAPLCVTGTITASGAIYSSDRNLKENIKSIDIDDINKVAAIDLKSFNFIDDESKTKVYGVIAQEVQEAGLDILVHQKEDGMLGVDYTSLLILKIAQLQKDNNNLVNFVASLDKRVKELEEKLNNKG